MDNYPFSNWWLAPTRIRPFVKKRWLQIAAFPGRWIECVFPRLAPLFPHAVSAPGAIHTGFTNANAMLHVANCVGNAGKIDRGESYRFYAEGVTPSVVRLYRAINAERVAVAAALDAAVPTLEDWFERIYGVRGADLPGDLPAADHQQRRPGPGHRNAEVVRAQIHHRGCAGRAEPMCALGAAAGAPTPAIDALITLVRAMTGSDFAAEARTLERMGLGGLGAAEIRRWSRPGWG